MGRKCKKCIRKQSEEEPNEEMSELLQFESDCMAKVKEDIFKSLSKTMNDMSTDISDNFDHRIDGLEERFNSQFKEINSQFKGINSQFNGINSQLKNSRSTEDKLREIIGIWKQKTEECKEKKTGLTADQRSKYRTKVTTDRENDFLLDRQLLFMFYAVGNTYREWFLLFSLIDCVLLIS